RHSSLFSEFSEIEEDDEKDSISGISKVMTFLSEISMLLVFIAFLQGKQSAQKSDEAKYKSSDQTISAVYSQLETHRMTLRVSTEGDALIMKAVYFDGENANQKDLRTLGEVKRWMRSFPDKRDVVIKIENKEALPYLSSILTTVKSE